jgi:hypothetical protein
LLRRILYKRMDTRIANDASEDQIARHLELDRIEAKILDEGKKSLFHVRQNQTQTRCW